MNIMGIDTGTTTISIVLIDEKTGSLVARETVEHRSFLPGERPDERIQDPERIWQLAREKMDALIHTCGKPAAIGLTGQMHGMLYVDENGRAVSPLYTWQDGSGNQVLENGKSSAESLREQVGAAATGYGLTTHYYLQKKGRIPAEAEWMTTMSDYIAMKLCGHTKPVIGADMAASWGCFDLEKKKFLYEALGAAGVDISYLPEVERNHFIVGKTEDGIPVMGSIGDNQASFLGSVESLCDTVAINIGTGSQVSFVSESYVPCEGSIELRPCKDSYLLTGSSLCGGRAYAMLEQFYREASGGKEDSCYRRMQEQASEFVGRYGIDAAWKIRTTFSGTRSNPGERGQITGIGVENFCPGAMTAGVIAGILDELYQQYRQMCGLTGRRAKRLAGSGNGLRRNPLMQRMAEELFEMKLEIPVCQEEAACGAALSAAGKCRICREL